MRRKVFLIILIALIALICFFVFYKITPSANLHKTVLTALSGAKGKYSVVVEDLKTGEKESLYGDKVYQAGSLYKLWVMATAFEQIKDGTLSKDEVLSEKVSVLNDIFNVDPEFAELKDGMVTLTVQDALKQMIGISHNYAALILIKRIKLSNVAKFLEKNGLKVSSVGNIPTTTADDIALFYKKLYNGELNNAKYTQEMLDLLKAQKLNEKLPKYLPKETIIAHKTGEINYVSHDGGIVFAPTGNYIIVTLSDSSYPPGAVERIAQISKSVYNYFSNKK